MKLNNRKSIILAVAVLILSLCLAWVMTGRHQLWPRGGGTGDVLAAKSRSANRPEADPARDKRRNESIKLAAQKRYEQLLEKYPRMMPTFRDVPDEKNGYLQFLLFAESLKESHHPDDLPTMFSDDSEWANKHKAWLAENRDYFDEILRIAELPDQSCKGISLDRLASVPGRYGSEFATVLRASSRLAFEAGDSDTALRYMKASLNMGAHIIDIESPTMLGEVIATGIRDRSRDTFLEGFLPTLVDDPEALRTWRDVLFRNETPTSEFARAITGEWNTVTRNLLLPAMLGDSTFINSIPDSDALVDSYTMATQKAADGIAALGPDRFDSAHGEVVIPMQGLDANTQNVADGVTMGLRGIVHALGVQSTSAAMDYAVIAILLGEELPVDPVSGKPFVWDPKSRMLSMPEGFSGPDPIKVPGKLGV